jgi:hypothetical protein
MKTIIAYLKGDEIKTIVSNLREFEMKTIVSYLREDKTKTILAHLILFASFVAVFVTLMFVIAYIDPFNYFV